MDVESLRWFQQVADGVTVTEVADLYLVSQPGVSRALGRLEEEVGTPLLTRQGRTLRPTHAGSVFKRHLDDALHDLDDALAAVSELLSPETGTVSVASQLSLGSWLLPRLIKEFRTDHPDVRFRIVPSDDALGSSMVAGGRIDLELTSRRPRNPEVAWRPLLSQPLALAVPPGHRLARRRAIGLAEAAEEDFVMLGPTWELRALSEAVCEAAGFAPRVAFEVDDLPVARGFVASGLGVALVPAHVSGRGAPQLPDPAQGPERLVALTDAGATREVGLAWSRARRLLPSAALFREHVLASVSRSNAREQRLSAEVNDR